MSYNRFKELCGKCWGNDNPRFILIDKDRVLNEGRSLSLHNVKITLGQRWILTLVTFGNNVDGTLGER